jgi:hypothetical protein
MGARNGLVKHLRGDFVPDTIMQLSVAPIDLDLERGVIGRSLSKVEGLRLGQIRRPTLD